MADDDLMVHLPISKAGLEQLGLGHLDDLPLDLGEIAIQESVEIQQRLGLPPYQFVRGLTSTVIGGDAVVLYAAVWLALRQHGRPTAWGDIELRMFRQLVEPAGETGGKGSTGESSASPE